MFIHFKNLLYYINFFINITSLTKLILYVYKYVDNIDDLYFY